MSKINQVTTSQLHVTHHLENNVKNVEIKKINQTNDSFFNKFCQLFKNNTAQSVTQNSANTFLKQTFSIPENAHMISASEQITYCWNESLDSYIPNAADQKIDTNNHGYTGKLPAQFIKDFNRMNYSMTFLGNDMPEFSNEFSQEDRLQFFAEFVTLPHAEKLCQIAHQGHLAEPYILLTLKNKNFDFIIPQSKENDKLKVNIEKTEDKKYIITSSNEYYLKQIQPEIILDKTILFTERKTHLITNQHDQLSLDPNQKDLLTFKITQKYN
ncbi:hypothetical protein GKR50_01840 [Providencia rustigianii]|uniref:hypothetical protein n=1 Tax=Providencia rustigianii TaxID=158850 RepID=UPI000F70D6D9|nr:hypothetical protein [Providencia rustigianii]MTC58757.1 hypothetical protein [Providencia rustigianii]VEH56645.1 Uncharacterised protein [Providencia rustigianii]